VGCGSNSFSFRRPVQAPFWRSSKACSSFRFLALTYLRPWAEACFLVDLIEARSSILPIAQHTRVVCRAMGVFLCHDERRLDGDVGVSVTAALVS